MAFCLAEALSGSLHEAQKDLTKVVPRLLKPAKKQHATQKKQPIKAEE